MSGLVGNWTFASRVNQDGKSGTVCLICPGTRQDFVESGGVCGVCVAISGRFCEVMDGGAIDSSFARMDSRGRLSLNGSCGRRYEKSKSPPCRKMRDKDGAPGWFFVRSKSTRGIL